MSIAKIIIIITVFVILTSLVFGLYFLFNEKGKSKRTAWALTARILISVLLFAGVIAAFYFGWITPHKIGR